MTTAGGASTFAGGLTFSSRIARSWSFNRSFSSAPSRICCRLARSRKLPTISAEVVTPMSDAIRLISRSSSADSSTVRVNARTLSMRSPRLSRVRATAWRIRSKMFFFSGSCSSFRLPNSVWIMRTAASTHLFECSEPAGCVVGSGQEGQTSSATCFLMRNEIGVRTFFTSSAPVVTSSASARTTVGS